LELITIAVALTPAQLPGYCGILRYCSKVVTNPEVRLGLAVAYGREQHVTSILEERSGL